MKPGTLVRLVKNKSLHNTIEVRSGSQGEDMANFRMVPMFTILSDMIGICVVEGGNGISMKVLFGDKLVWVGMGVVEPVEQRIEQ
jgi:hypothetical protein